MNSPAPRSDSNPGTQTAAPAFILHEMPGTPDPDPRIDESLMRRALDEGPSACIWQMPQGLVVPRTYLRSPDFDRVCAGFASRGWPVSVRHSGGGVVPQGPGILNISLAYAVEGPPLDHSDDAYRHLCNILSDTITPLGIQTCMQAVEGSFCDGRFNLACRVGTDVRKIAGTAQLWRRLPDANEQLQQVVLVHGLLLVAIDVHAVTQQANALEQALDHARRYLPERAASLHELTTYTMNDKTEFTHQVATALETTIRASQCP